MFWLIFLAIFESSLGSLQIPQRKGDDCVALLKEHVVVYAGCTLKLYEDQKCQKKFSNFTASREGDLVLDGREEVWDHCERMRFSLTFTNFGDALGTHLEWWFRDASEMLYRRIGCKGRIGDVLGTH